MEAAGIVEVIELAPQKYECFYLRWVGDGYSSVADCIVCNVSLQQHVYQKVILQFLFSNIYLQVIFPEQVDIGESDFGSGFWFWER